LSQDSLLDVLVSVDGRRKAVDKIVDDGIFSGHPHKLILLVIVEDSTSLLSFEPVFFKDPERDQIDVSVEH